MFHLFNNIYLEHDSRYHTRDEHIILNYISTNHPMSKTFNIEFDHPPTFDEILKTKHNDDIDNFWTWLLDKKEEFVIFADSVIFHQLQIQLWKSVFPKSTSESIFNLYQFFLNDYHLKKFLYSDGRLSITTNLNRPYYFDDFSNFNSQYITIQKSEALSNMDKGMLSFEYLMANFAYNPLSKYREDFINRVEKLAWKSWFNDMNALKTDIIGCFYDIQTLIPEINVHNKNSQEILETIASDKNLQWITDTKFNEYNITYIKRTYPAKVICDLIKNVNSIWGVSFNQFKDTNGPIAFDQIQFTTLLYEGKYLEILDRDVLKGFGCFFVNDKIIDKANLLFSSFLYEKIREKQTSELKTYQLD